MLPSKRISRIAAIVVVALVLYAAGYAWFVRSHTAPSLHSDVIEVADSPLDCGLLFVFYPALWLDARYIGFYDTGHFTNFNRVHAHDRDEIPGYHVFPFTTNGTGPEPLPSDSSALLLLAAALVLDASAVVAVIFLLDRLNRNDRIA